MLPFESAPKVKANWTMVVAVAKNGVIGKQGDLPWKLSSDLQRFKRMTMGHCLLMGRKTYESIGRPLPGRQTIVLSQSNFQPNTPEISVVSDLSAVDSVVETGRSIMVVGGAQIYRIALPCCETLWLTRVEQEIEGDTYFPEVDWSRWQLDSEQTLPAGPKDDFDTSFQVWSRKSILAEPLTDGATSNPKAP